MNKKIKLLIPNIYRYFLGVIFIVSLFLNYSCTEEANLIGANLLPGDDKIEFYYDSTLTFDSYIVKQEPFKTRNFSSYYLGYLNSSYYGITEASIITQYKPLIYDWVYDSVTVDSIVLFLQVDTIFGFPSDDFPINVYELDSAISGDDIYYNDSEYEYMYSVSNKLNTSYRIQGDSLLVFPLNIDLANRIIEDSVPNKADSLFVRKFKGISIVPETVTSLGGQLFNVNLAAVNTKMVLYYNDTLSFSYYLNKGDKRFATYRHNPNGSVLGNLLQNNPTEVDSLMFIQGLNGVTTKFIFNNYSSWVGNNNYSILKAELILPVYSINESSKYRFPSKLFFVQMDKDSNYFKTEDATYSKFFSDGLDKSSKFYSFDISRYLKNLVNGVNTDSTIYIKLLNNSVEPNRVILKSGNNIKLKVSYSKH